MFDKKLIITAKKNLIFKCRKWADLQHCVMVSYADQKWPESILPEIGLGGRLTTCTTSLVLAALVLEDELDPTSCHL